jgi:hypothetical protein
MTGTNCDLFTHNQSRSDLNHLVLVARRFIKSDIIFDARHFPASYIRTWHLSLLQLHMRVLYVPWLMYCFNFLHELLLGFLLPDGNTASQPSSLAPAFSFRTSPSKLRSNVGFGVLEVSLHLSKPVVSSLHDLLVFCTYASVQFL